MSSGYYLTIRIESDLKTDFSKFCNCCGITLSLAVRLLIKQTIAKNRIPFQINELYERQAYLLSKQDSRISIRLDCETKDQFNDICNHTGISMGQLIKLYMVHCIKSGELILYQRRK